MEFYKIGENIKELRKILEALEYELEIEEKNPFYYFDASKL
jgi:hypothetical protein